MFVWWIRHRRLALVSRLLLLAGAAGIWFNVLAEATKGNASPKDFATRSQAAYLAAMQRFRAEPTNSAVAWELGRAIFDRAEYAANDAERATLAEQGIGVCRQLIARESGLAPAHYYLAMNLGQLARTKSLGALRIVNEIEREFKAARQLDERLDFAGPDRNLGVLYLEAPAIGSVGSRTKARLHLQRAVELRPDYPDNRLSFAEALLKWGDQTGAKRELLALENLWPAAQTNFSGEEWGSSWLDWEARLKKLHKRITDLGKVVESPRGKP